MKLSVDEKRCPANHPCPSARICPVDAIKQENGTGLPIIDQDKCIKCKKCIKYCPMGAFKVVE